MEAQRGCSLTKPEKKVFLQVLKKALARLSQSPLLLVSGLGVGPSVKDFYHLQRTKFTGEIFLQWCYPIRNGVNKVHVSLSCLG